MSGTFSMWTPHSTLWSVNLTAVNRWVSGERLQLSPATVGWRRHRQNRGGWWTSKPALHWVSTWNFKFQHSVPLRTGSWDEAAGRQPAPWRAGDQSSKPAQDGDAGVVGGELEPVLGLPHPQWAGF